MHLLVSDHGECKSFGAWNAPYETCLHVKRGNVNECEKEKGAPEAPLFRLVTQLNADVWRFVWFIALVLRLFIN